MHFMLYQLRNNFLKFSATLILAIILLLSVGLVFAAGGPGSDHAGMIGCPLMDNNGTLCPMGIVGHLATWVNLDGAILDRSGMLMSIAIVIAVFVFASVGTFSRWRKTARVLGLRQFLYTRSFPHLKLLEPVRILFSEGILNPKTF